MRNIITINTTITKLFFLFGILFTTQIQAQDAKSLLDEVSSTMTSYKNMEIAFSSSLSNEEAGIKEGDEPPIKGKILLQGEKYHLTYLGNTFIFDGKKLYVINHEEKEITINEGDMEGEDGFIYPSKILTFYKEGFKYKLGKKKTSNGKKIQEVELTPIDSNSQILKVILSIDTDNKHIVSLSQFGENKSKTTLTISSLKKNQPLSNTIFSFDKKKFEKENYTID